MKNFLLNFNRSKSCELIGRVLLVPSKSKMLMFAFLLGGFQLLFAQNQVTGNVVEKTSGMPLGGVNIVEKGTRNGVVSDFDGNYTIQVNSSNSVLVFTYLGYKTQEQIVGNQAQINVVLEDDLNQLDEVVLVDYGYGKVKRENMTGSVASISSVELAKIPVSSAAEALSGRLPGVNISTSDGEPGAEIQIRVRGGGSITQDNSPLFVVDGFIVSSISDIPPADILSIDVLKDAAATAVYGAQASNGVVVISTKSPKEGKISVNYNNFFQFNELPQDRRYDVLDPYEYVMANYEYALIQGATSLKSFERYYGVYDDIELYKNKVPTDWQEKLFGGSRVSAYNNINISGGTDVTKIRLSISNNDDQGLLEGSGYERTAINFKLNQKISDKLVFDAQARITNTIKDGAGTSSNSQLKIKDAVQTRPVNGIVDEIALNLNSISSDDDYQMFLRSMISPDELVKQDWRKRTDNDYIINAALSWEVLEGLNFKTSYTTSKGFREDLRFFGPLTGESFNNGGSMPLGQKANTETNSYRLINTISFKKQLENSKVDLLFGNEISSSTGKNYFIRAEEFRMSITPEELFANMAFGTVDRTYTTNFTPSNRLSYFGRADYQLNDTYMLTGTFRADQSSRFSKENRLGIFPAIALGVKLEQLNFFKDIESIDQLKLRLSFGSTGNDRIDATATQFLFSASTLRGIGFNNYENVYYSPSSSSLYNPNLKWETTLSKNLGLDFGFFNNRLRGSLDVYENETKDLLLMSAIPNNTGFSTQWNNVGSTQNKGLELGLNASLYQSNNANVSLSFNIGKNDFTIVELDGTDERFERSNWASTDLNNINDYYLQVGGKVGDIYGYVTDGMYSTSDFTSYNEADDSYTLADGVVSSGAVVGNQNIRPGFLKLKDINGDGVLNADDRKVIGNAIPDFQGGFGLNANYKNFDISMFFNYQFGNDVYNTGKIQFNQFRRVRYGNLLSGMSMENRFTYIDLDGSYTGEPGGLVTDLDDLSQMNTGKSMWSHSSHGIAGAVIHDWAVEDGSFLRLNNLTFGYSLPKDFISKFGISNFRVFATGRNLKLWTKYSGYDPEVSSNRNPLTPGIDYSSYPRSRSYTFGLNLTF